MKKILLLLFTIYYLLFTPSYSMQLEGGVKYNVDSAREYVQERQLNNIQVTGPFTLQAGNVERVVYSKNPLGEIIAMTVLYKGTPDKTYIYDKNKKLIYTENYDKPVNIYPHRGYRYDLDGKLVLTSLTVSKDEMFRFTPDGKLLAYSINGIIYDEKGNIIGKAK